MARETYDGGAVRDLDFGLEVIDSDRAHGRAGMGRVYALRHADPALMVLAFDDDFEGTLSGSMVVTRRNVGPRIDELIRLRYDEGRALDEIRNRFRNRRA